ncbi:SxtJ family membrane protein [Salidesulfovibrio onnuriiensis]|uniref:SxtJ family membrane protein n=1 Tax=Salidesulfovibrio onnuriiensis TaxID=2583823 RepID=UPI0011C9CAF3|nr:SxtJ family membrane protein [Salidesulfovibrio onnuriiensis]
MIDAGKQNRDGFIPASISRREAVDTGMAMVLICLIAWFATRDARWTVAAVAVLVVNMVWPVIFTPVAKVWLGLSHVLGTVMSKLVLGVVFFGLVTPLALVRRVFGHDPMALSQWKKGASSVFVVRDHAFTSEEIERPF